jgi:dolichyl-phosphate-mannose-protein mannosyltransferase
MKLKYLTSIIALASLFFCINAFASAGNGGGGADTGKTAVSNTAGNSGNDSGNLVLNGDFEDVFKGQPNFWSKDAWHMEPEVTKVTSEKDGAYSGQYYVTIENVQSNDARLIQDVAVKPSTVYLLSCYVKASNVTPGKSGASICIMQPNFFEYSPHFEDTGGKWQYVEFAVKTAPDQKMLRVAIRLGFFGADCIGKASFDKFRLEEVTDPSNLSPRSLGSAETQVQKAKSSTSGLLIIFIIAGLLVAGIIAFIIFALASKKKGPKDKGTNGKQGPTAPPGTDEADDTPSVLLKRDNTGFTMKDILLAFGLTAVYAVIAFSNLGSTEAPTTYWRPVSRGESAVADFGSEQLIRRVYYWEGLPGGHKPDESKYEVEGSLDGTTWTHIALLNPKTICWWYFETVSVQARYVRVTADVPSSWLNEVVFLGNDKDHPIKIAKVIPGPRNEFTEGKVENIFDEYSDVGNVKAKKHLVYRPSILTGMSPGFDEQYHGRTALEYLNQRRPYEDTHPPLGKALMALGILIFGMTPFGWRFMGVFFGVLIIPFMFAFGKRLFKKTEYAFIAAFLMAFDFMHFTQSRIATIDTFPVFFIILTFYFMYRFCEMSFINTDFRKMLLPLLLSGICWGLGSASKWIALYAFPGLVIIFFVNLYKKSQEVREAKLSKSLKKNKDEWAVIQAKIDQFPVRAWQLFGWCVVVFTVVPAILYFLSYIPIMFSKDLYFNFGWIIENQTGMYRYHSELQATHSYSSRWFEWPLMTKPMAYNFGEGLPDGQTQRLFAFGNPAVWWIGSLAAIACTAMAIAAYIRRVSTTLDHVPKNMRGSMVFTTITRNALFKDEVRFVILIGLACEYLPWVISPRQLTFIYHFFASVPFIIFCIVYLIKLLREKVLEPMKEKDPGNNKFMILGNSLIYAYLAIVAILFVMFYPIIAGVPADTKYIQNWLVWFSNSANSIIHWYFG